jgi:hypothetical protein
MGSSRGIFKVSDADMDDGVSAALEEAIVLQALGVVVLCSRLGTTIYSSSY